MTGSWSAPPNMRTVPIGRLCRVFLLHRCRCNIMHLSDVTWNEWKPRNIHSVHLHLYVFYAYTAGIFRGIFFFLISMQNTAPYVINITVKNMTSRTIMGLKENF